MHTFDHIVLNGRPGGGKSELIDFLKGVPLQERIERFHVGVIHEIDDFPWLWDKFVEDDLWEELGEARKYSRTVPGGYVQTEGDRLLDLMILKLGRVIERDYLTDPTWYEENTLFIEYSRGSGDGGYRRSYDLFGEAIWKRAAVVYISVSYEESVRRNEARYQAALAHSILAHRLPDESQERFSKAQDFHEVADGRGSGYLALKGCEVPFISIHNEPELKEPAALAERYAPAMTKLAALVRPS